MMRTYTAHQIPACLQNVIFRGDSSVRQLFWALARRLDAGRAQFQDNRAVALENQHFSFNETDIVFIWDPYLNASISLPMADLHIVGGGLWPARYLASQGVMQYQGAIAYYNQPSTLIIPPLIPKYDLLNHERRITITPAKIDQMHRFLRQEQLPVIWAASKMLQQTSYQSDGLHLQSETVDNLLDVLLNWKCNRFLRQRYPQDGTCCREYPRPTNLQVCLVGILVIGCSWILLRRLLLRSMSDRLLAILITGLALIYCYAADRSHLFQKDIKSFRFLDFFILVSCMPVIGWISLRKTSGAFLGRDQSDELKGWMQFVILVYHYLGASSVLPIYKVVRVLVSTYLFLTGYGHCIFYLRKADFSLHRVAQVLFRLNFLSIAMAWIMNTDYLFYYFAPLTSFWYLVVFLTMKLHHNSSFVIVSTKILVALLATDLLIQSSVTDLAFYQLTRILHVDWNTREWLFRLRLDSVIVFVGMFCGLITHHCRISPRSIYIASIAALMGLPAAVYMAIQSTSKEEFNVWMPLFSPVPILSFLVLRNSTEALRSHYSVAFAWLGRCSLETFTLQFHIWMAADTKGLLRTGFLSQGLGYYGESVILSMLFLWISGHVSSATGTLTRWIFRETALLPQ